ncbi:MAG: Hsp20/alpha crystallin family protein [Methanospirillaceae archaeon]|nr:Hsp20/alpha crystallin family protein [Methanospirillaceae archaeon]
MQNNPFDDLLKNLAQILEQISQYEKQSQKESEGEDISRIIGCAFITRMGKPDALHMPDAEAATDDPDDHSHEIYAEITPGDDYLYITAILPAAHPTNPCVMLTPDRVIISAGFVARTLPLPWTADLKASSYEIKNGIIDITVTRAGICCENPESPVEEPNR